MRLNPFFACLLCLPATAKAQAVKDPPLQHVVTVPTIGTPQQNGQRLLQFINGVAPSASASQPFLLQLDAGTYDLGPGVIIPPYISLRGAGMLSTFLTSTDTALYFVNAVDTTGISFSVSDMTVSAANRTLASPSVTNVFIDRVHFTGGLFVLDAQLPHAVIVLSNSIFNGSTQLDNLFNDPTISYRIIGSELDSLTRNSGTAPGNIGCFATYNAVLTPYNSVCL